MKQAVVLAGGEGYRLRPFTNCRPKAMIFIGGRPIIEYVIEALEQNQIREIILIAGYKREQLYDYIGDGRQFGVNIRYVHQESQLGPADALGKVRDFTENEFLVLPGDKLITADTIKSFVTVVPPAVMVKKTKNPTNYGMVVTDGSKLVEIIKPPSSLKSNKIDIGIYCFKKDIFQYLENGMDIPDALNSISEKQTFVSVIETGGPWLDLVYPWDIINLNSIILGGSNSRLNGVLDSGVFVKGKVRIGNNTLIRSNSSISGPVEIGSGCDIGPNVCLQPDTSIGDNVIIGPFSELRNCVIGNDVQIYSGAVIHDSVIDRGCIIGSHFCTSSEQVDIKIENEYHTVKIGAMIGEGCKIGNNVVSLAGTILGSYCTVKSLCTIEGRLPDKSILV
jgi:UDP-N-acetylglucosamine diphosphorylase / glucose-1-phosphate thymidylyltransferase / UDP-N-acetylgalactosamine diphosphorylase / glucosamine-1-phosphate N-acetyltransferase / galactosamine-1-phosphate N-acetyltransferase